MSTRPVIADMLADAQAFLDGGVDELTALLDEVASYGDQPVPAPSPALALLLAGRPAATAPRPQRPAVPVRLRTRRAMAGLAAAAVSGLSLTGAAAVANELPAPMQRAVAHFSEQYFPFSFPRPLGDPPVPGGPVGTVPGQGGARTDSTPDRAENGTTGTGAAKAGQGAQGGESRGRTAPVTGPTRTTGSPKDRTGSASATGPAKAGGHAPATRGANPDAVRGGQDDSVEPDPGSAADSDKPTTPPRGHAHAGSGNSGQGAEVTPQRPAHTPKDRGTGAGSGADKTAPVAAKEPRSAQGATDGSAASPGAGTVKSDAAQSDTAKVRAGAAPTGDGAGGEPS